MNTSKMNDFVFVKDLNLGEEQELQVPLGFTVTPRDLEMLLGKDFDDFASITEKKLWATLERTVLQNQPES